MLRLPFSLKIAGWGLSQLSVHEGLGRGADLKPHFDLSSDFSGSTFVVMLIHFAAGDKWVFVPCTSFYQLWKLEEETKGSKKVKEQEKGHVMSLGWASTRSGVRSVTQEASLELHHQFTMQEEVEKSISFFRYFILLHFLEEIKRKHYDITQDTDASPISNFCPLPNLQYARPNKASILARSWSERFKWETK